MKILVAGHGRHGKDTVCKMLGLPWQSSSEFAGLHVVWPRMPWYPTWESCYEDRHNHREFWRDCISEYNRDDPAQLAKDILAVSDVYCGMRRRVELQASRPLFDHVIWVDAGKRLGYNDPTCEITAADCDHTFDNNQTEQELQKVVESWLLKYTGTKSPNTGQCGFVTPGMAAYSGLHPAPYT